MTKKFKIIIEGISYGSIEKHRVWVDVPVSELEKEQPKTIKFGALTLPNLQLSESELAERWINDNYEAIVVPLAEKVDLWPIHGFKLAPTVKKANKKQEFKTALQSLVDAGIVSEKIKDEIEAAATKLWASIKSLSTEKQLEIALSGVGIAATAQIEAYTHIREVLNYDKDTEIASPETIEICGQTIRLK